MNKALMMLMTFGAMVFWLPVIADPYMTPRLLLVALGASLLLARKSDSKSSLEIPALAMVMAVVISAAFAKDKYYAVIGSYQFGMDSLLAFACYFGVLAAAARSGEGVDSVAGMVSAASIPVSLYGIFQRFFKDPLIWGDLHGGTRVSSTQGGPVFLGAVMALAILCSLHLAKKGSRTSLLALALAVPCLVFTQSRAPSSRRRWGRPSFSDGGRCFLRYRPSPSSPACSPPAPPTPPASRCGRSPSGRSRTTR